MHIIGDVSEDEFIVHFLQTEITSSRFGSKISGQLIADGQSKSIIENPNLNDETQNIYRRTLLGKTRGYGRNADLFENFPSSVSWKRVILSKTDLESALYINWDYWNMLSRGTRSVKDGAKSIKEGRVIYSVPNDNFWQAAEAINSGKTFKELVFVAHNEQADLVVLEGHLRLTAYFLIDRLPERLSAIVGFSPNMHDWDMY